MSITGINKVITSTENSICVIVNGQTVNIEGEKLSVTKLDLENGILDVEGTITAIKYAKAKQKENFIKRIFG
jgi:sporulation protein YabP